MVRGGGKAGDDDDLGLDVGEVVGVEHGAEERSGVESVVGLGGGDGEEAEVVGVEVVKLALIAEAHDNRLGMRERRECVLVRELRDQATEAGGVREVRGVGVSKLGFFGFAVAKKGEKLMVTGFQGGCGGGMLERREWGL